MNAPPEERAESASRPWTAGRVLAIIVGVALTLVGLGGGIGSAAANFPRDPTAPDLAAWAIDVLIALLVGLGGAIVLYRALRRRRPDPS